MELVDLADRFPSDFHGYLLPEALDVSTLPFVEYDSIQELWVNDFYAGPLEAVVELAGERLLLVSLDRPPEWPRRVVLFRVPPERMEWERQEHEAFARQASVLSGEQLELGPAMPTHGRKTRKASPCFRTSHAR